MTLIVNFIKSYWLFRCFSVINDYICPIINNINSL